MADNPVKPAALQRGDTVGVIAPASAVEREAFAAGCEGLRRMGYRPFYFDDIFERDLYFAGSVRRRAAELHAMFEREDVKAIVCARGGYGCALLLPELSAEAIRRHPKVFVGYSDVTALLAWLHDAAGLVTFHGPMVCRDFAAEDGVDEPSWQAAVAQGKAWTVSPTAEALAPGEAEGVLYGGCLSMLVASLRTPFEIHTAGKVLLLEDVNAKPYQIDRMLTQLNQAGKMEGVLGIVFGEMLGCVQGAGQNYTLQEVVKRAVGDLGIPVAYGLRSGHVLESNLTLPIGVRCRLRVDKEARLELLEPAVTPAATEAGVP